jgi:hypothetical protein
MNTNTIDIEKTADYQRTALEGQARRFEESQAREEGAPAEEGSRQTAGGRKQQEGRDDRVDEAPRGATLAEIMTATKWQAHSVPGFVSILGSKGGEKIESSKSDGGERTYKIAK